MFVGAIESRGGRARLNECRQVLIVKEHRRGGVSDYRPDRSVTGSIEGRAER